MSRLLQRNIIHLTLTEAWKGHSPNGTAPLVSDGDGTTASVNDIISNIDAKEPRILVFRAELTRLRLSSSMFRSLPGFAVLLKVSK